MNDVEIVVGIRGDTSGGRAIQGQLNQIGVAGDNATNSTKRLEGQINSLRSTANAASRAFFGMMAAFGAREIVRIADNYTLFDARLKSITGSTQEASRAMRELREISNRTGTEIGVSIGIMQRLSFVRDEINATNDDLLVFTETVSKLGVTSGASNEAMRAGLTQLGQSISSQIVRAEEFNSIMENIPAVGKAIADELGVTTGQMRQLVIEGELLSKDVFAAILNQTIRTREEFERFPRTAAQGWKQMINSVSTVIDLINKSTNGTNALGGVFRAMGEGVKLLYNGLATMWDGIIAGILEGINLLKISLNSVIGTINNAIQYTPFRGSQIEGLQVDDVGSFMAQANADRRQREANLYSDPFAKQSQVVTREISKDYEDIVSGLSESTEKSKELTRIHKELEKVVSDTRTDQEAYNIAVRELEALRPYARTAEEAEAITRALKNAQVEFDKLRIEAELKSPTAKAFASLASEIDDSFKDSFKSVFTDGEKGFEDMLDGWKASFRNLLSELAYQAAVRPVMVSIVGAIGGMVGMSQGGIDSIMGNVTGAPNILGGGTGGGGLGGLSSIGSSLLNGSLYSQTMGQFGAGVGNLLTGQAWGAMGPSAGAAIGAGAFGNLGYGALGGLGANMLGLGSDNAMVNMASGTLGSLAGGAIGTSMGTILGMAGGPIGAIAGAFIGTALGGLFGGGKPSNKTQYGGLDLSTLEQNNIGGMTGKKFSQQNADFRDAVLGEAAKLAQALQSVGGSTSGQLNITVGSRDGLWLFNEGQSVTGSGGNLGANTRQNFGNDSEAFLKAVLERVVDSTTGLSETFQSIVDRVGVTDTAKLGQALEFGRMYEAFIQEAATPTEILEQALEALNKQLVSLQEQAIELGLPIDELTVAYEKQKQITLDSIKAQMAGFTSLEAMTKAYDTFLNGQALGSNSSLSPTDKLALAQGNFDSLLEKAQGGDYTVTQDLLKAADQLLNIGRGVYASSMSFASLESFVRSSITDIARASGVPGYAVGTNSAAAGLAMVGERGRELVQMGGGEKVWTANETAGIMAMSDTVAADVVRSNTQIAAINQEMLDELKALRSESMRQRKEIERLNNRMAVKK